MNIVDMGPDDRRGGTFYPSLPPRGGYRHAVIILGVERTDYIKNRNALGEPGYFFPALSRDELCNASILEVPNER